MSEQGWQEFLAAEGVEDWVVLHGGATAVFRVSSLGEAASLAAAVAQVPGLDGSGALLTVGAASWTTPTPLRAGSLPTGPATACASPLGPTALCPPLLLNRSRCERGCESLISL